MNKFKEPYLVGVLEEIFLKNMKMNSYSLDYRLVKFNF